MRRPRPSSPSGASARPARKRVVRIDMPSRRDAVAPTVERIVKAARGAGLGREKLHDLAVAVAEALSNAAVHGNRLNADQDVDITVTVTKGSVEVEVEDSGTGFDSTAAPDPTEPTRVLAPGGRGIFLMRRLANSVEYNRAGNAVRVTVRRAGTKG